jgi:hypothetical protein
MGTVRGVSQASAPSWNYIKKSKSRNNGILVGWYRNNEWEGM